MNYWTKKTKQATRVAAKYNSPSLPPEVWAEELGIPKKRVEGFPTPVSWGQIIRIAREKDEQKEGSRSL